MSCSSHLPPRSPVQNRGLAVGSTTGTMHRDTGLHSEHHRFPFQGTYLEEETLWLDDLSINPKTSSKGILLRRSASDPVALLQGSSTFHSPIYAGCEGSSISTTDGSETDCDFDMTCLYGPNSPRQKNELAQSQSMIVSALLENVSLNSCQHLHKEFPADSRTVQTENVRNSSCDNILGKASRRRSRQRSRVRKLQYIAELERAVDEYKVMGAELAGSVASMFQQWSLTSIENKRLNQQIATLQQQKMIKEGQYLYLENEVGRLRALSARLQQNTGASRLGVGPSEASNARASWQMLDLGKLSLSGGQ